MRCCAGSDAVSEERTVGAWWDGVWEGKVNWKPREEASGHRSPLPPSLHPPHQRLQPALIPEIKPLSDG